MMKIKPAAVFVLPFSESLSWPFSQQRYQSFVRFFVVRRRRQKKVTDIRASVAKKPKKKGHEINEKEKGSEIHVDGTYFPIMDFSFFNNNKEGEGRITVMMSAAFVPHTESRDLAYFAGINLQLSFSSRKLRKKKKKKFLLLLLRVLVEKMAAKINPIMYNIGY